MKHIFNSLSSLRKQQQHLFTNSRKEELIKQGTSTFQSQTGWANLASALWKSFILQLCKNSQPFKSADSRKGSCSSECRCQFFNYQSSRKNELIFCKNGFCFFSENCSITSPHSTPDFTLFIRGKKQWQKSWGNEVVCANKHCRIANCIYISKKYQYCTVGSLCSLEIVCVKRRGHADFGATRLKNPNSASDRFRWTIFQDCQNIYSQDIKIFAFLSELLCSQWI